MPGFCERPQLVGQHWHAGRQGKSVQQAVTLRFAQAGNHELFQVGVILSRCAGFCVSGVDRIGRREHR
jgi:hypothetical protein